MGQQRGKGWIWGKRKQQRDAAIVCYKRETIQRVGWCGIKRRVGDATHDIIFFLPARRPHSPPPLSFYREEGERGRETRGHWGEKRVETGERQE